MNKTEDEVDHRLSGLGFAILRGLQHKAHVYGGTARPEVVARRRAKNRVARRSRRVNRVRRG